jgi:hypothetical protein
VPDRAGTGGESRGTADGGWTCREVKGSEARTDPQGGDMEATGSTALSRVRFAVLRLFQAKEA